MRRLPDSVGIDRRGHCVKPFRARRGRSLNPSTPSYRATEGRRGRCRGQADPRPTQDIGARRSRPGDAIELGKCRKYTLGMVIRRCGLACSSPPVIRIYLLRTACDCSSARIEPSRTNPEYFPWSRRTIADDGGPESSHLSPRRLLEKRSREATLQGSRYRVNDQRVTWTGEA